MATITRPLSTGKTTPSGRPGQYLFTEYLRAREHQALVRRDHLTRTLPRSAAKAAAAGLVVSLVMAFGARIPFGYILLIFVLIVAGWSAVIIVAAFGVDSEIETLRVCAEAERKTARGIARLRRHGWVILPDRRVPSADTTVGHILVGPGGVIVINSDPANGTVRYTKKVATVDGEPLTGAIQRTAFLGGEIRAKLREQMPMVKVPVAPLLVMVDATVLWKDGAVDGVTILNLRAVVGWVKARQQRLNPGEVKQVIGILDRYFPPFVDGPAMDRVPLDRDVWLSLMDALATIRRGGGVVDQSTLRRLAVIEAELARQGDEISRLGLAYQNAVTPTREEPGPDAAPAPAGGDDSAVIRTLRRVTDAPERHLTAVPDDGGPSPAGAQPAADGAVGATGAPADGAAEGTADSPAGTKPEPNAP
ncbi:MAG: NERD domain-containing protein [Frankia sp.]|nr:NERD domain-containing protein [Frankia sp.]